MFDIPEMSANDAENIQIDSVSCPPCVWMCIDVCIWNVHVYTYMNICVGVCPLLLLACVDNT